MNAKLEMNELFKIEHDEYGTFYFDSLHRAGEFIGCGRAPLAYWVNKEGKGYNGWHIHIVNGADIKWSDINKKREELNINFE